MTFNRALVLVALGGFSCTPGIVDDPTNIVDLIDETGNPEFVGSTGARTPSTSGGSGSGPSDDPTAPGGSDDPTEDPAPSGPTGPVCRPSDVRATDAPLRRLTPIEYTNTVRDLFAGVALPAFELVDEVNERGFDNDAGHQAVSSLHVERFRETARAIATAVAADQRWLGCDPVADEAGCAAQVVEDFGRRAYRRPLTAAESGRFSAFFETARTSFGFDDALRMFVEGVLESTSFLYRPEVGSDVNVNGAVALDDYEVASRLSYFFLETMPDDALMAAAAQGALHTPEQVEAQAYRLLADPRAHDVVARFHRQWLKLDRLDGLALARTQFPSFDPTVRAALIESTERYLDYAFWEDGRFETLMTSRVGFVNDTLADVFGVPPPGSSELVPMTLDDSQRAGILTQPGVLASTSHPITHSPILRGVFVLDGILCAPPPAAPPGVNTTIPDSAEAPDAHTTRERIEQTHGTAECSSCHDSIDGMGFSFENYDALGRFRTQENGYPVDATGAVVGTRDIDGQVDGAVALAERLVDSSQVQACFAAHWFRFALGRTEARADTCQVEALADVLAENDGSIEAMLIALVTSPAFLTRPEI